MKKRKIKFRFKLLLLAAFLAYAGFAIYSQQMNIKAMMAEQETLEAEYAQVQTDLSRLQHESDYMYTEDYVEDAAREKFGLVYPDEIVIVPDKCSFGAPKGVLFLCGYMV